MPEVIPVELLSPDPARSQRRKDRAGALDPERAGRAAPSAPDVIVRWVFYFSLFAIPFGRLYLPGTGEHIGVTRLVQVLLLCSVLIQPRVCLRFVPVSLLWFLSYCAFRLLMGWWLSPELYRQWWPQTFLWLQFSLPWFWVMFNMLQHPAMARRGLWALVLGCSLCAALHMAGIGTGMGRTIAAGRSSIFGENPNTLAGVYASGLIALMGLAMFKDQSPARRLGALGLIGLLGAGLAKTGSRTGALLVALGAFILMFQTQAFAPRLKRYVMLLLTAVVLAGVVCQIPTVMNRLEKSDWATLQVQEGRVRMAPVLWEIFLRSPLYGSGPVRYEFELTRRAMPYLIREQSTIAAHNTALMLLVETGVIGFAIYAFGLWPALVSAWQGRRRACGLLPMALLLPWVLASLTVSNPIAAPVFWLAIAYALAGPRQIEPVVAMRRRPRIAATGRRSLTGL